jgi:glycosyltransferase involved in cell wall biosynthesis
VTLASARAGVVVNGRFLRARPTGLHRVARQLLAAGRAAGVDGEVVVPSGTSDPLAHRALWAPPGRAGQHLWEQAVLPRAAGARPLLSLANTAPIGARAGVVMVHDLATRVGPQWFRRELRLYGAVVVAAARRARAVLTVSEHMAADLAAIGIPAARIRVIRNAVGPEFRPAPSAAVADLRRRLDLRHPYAVMIGWADPRKDVATAVAAHRAVVGAAHHELLLVGAEHRNFAPVADPSGGTVRRIGYVPDGALPVLLSGAAALLYPSHYEGFGLPPVEALACGTPALVSDIPVLREATEGQAVYLATGDVDEWADALRAALDGRIRAGAPPAWSWDDAGRALRRVLDDVAAGGL